MTANTTALLFLLSATLILGADVDGRSRARSLWRWDSACDGDPALCVAKRLGVDNRVEPVSCSCEARPGLQDLGPGFYPRFLPYVVCSVAAACWSPLYRCATRDYSVHVLTRRDTAGVGVGVSSDDGVMLPAALRNDWTLQQFTVGVACECSLELPVIN